MWIFLKNLRILEVFFIGLIILTLVQVCYAENSGINNPERVNQAIEQAAADRRFSYPEGKLPRWDEELELLSEGPLAGKLPEESRQRPWWLRFGTFNIRPTFFTYLFIGMAVIFLSLIIYRMLLLYRLGHRTGDADGIGATGKGYEDLSASGHFALAEKFVMEGRFSEALSALMMALLLTLDARRLIRYHRSRTNREYLWRLKPHPILYSVADEFMHQFERMKYGRKVPDADGLAYLIDLYRQMESAIPALPGETVTSWDTAFT